MSINGQMDKEDMVRIYNGILLSHKKKQIWVSWTELDEQDEPVIPSEVSQKVKQISYITAFIWNPEKWYLWTYLEGSSRYAYIETRLVDTVGEGKGEFNWDSSFETCTLPCVI